MELLATAIILFACWGWRVERELKQLRRQVKQLKNGRTYDIDYGKGRDGSV
jgi:hypothetical protein